MKERELNFIIRKQTDLKREIREQRELASNTQALKKLREQESQVRIRIQQLKAYASGGAGSQIEEEKEEAKEESPRNARQRHGGFSTTSVEPQGRSILRPARNRSNDSDNRNQIDSSTQNTNNRTSNDNDGDN